MSVLTHLDSLNEKHAALETEIAEESHRPQPDNVKLTHLKREKLRLKEEIDRLNH